MFNRSHFIYFISFLALLGPAVAANLYRMDFRPPTQVHQEGGLVSKDPDGDGSVLDHVRAVLGNDDPWVSTTSDKKLAREGARSPGNAYVYYIDPTGLNPVDTIKAFRDAGEEHPHPGEKEFSIHGSIPWSHIVKWDTYTRGKKTGTTTRQQFEQGQGSSAKGRLIRSFIA